jgi:fibronectin-binding autotransporter adhesin
LGSTAAGTTVTSGASLGLSGGGTFGSGETLTIVGIGAFSRGALQNVAGNNTYAGNIEIGANGAQRIGTMDGTSLTLTGNITQAPGVTTGSILFRAATAGDWITLSGTGSSFGDNSTVFSTATTTSGYGGVLLGVNNALPTNRTISGVNGTGNATALDLNGYNQTLNGLITGQAGLSIINRSSTPSTLTLNPTADAATTNTLILGQSFLGVISVEKIGEFSQTLSGNNTYRGGTTVTGGTLLIGSNAVPVGTGTIGVSPIGRGNLTLGEGTTLALSSSTNLALYVPMVNVGGNVTIGTTANTGRLSLMGTVDLGGGNRIVTLGRASSNATAPYVSGAEVFRFDNNATFGGSSIVQNSLTSESPWRGQLCQQHRFDARRRRRFEWRHRQLFWHGNKRPGTHS